MSKSNVTYELETSPFVYQEGDMCLYFSSAFNLRRFKEQVNNYIDIEDAKLKAKFGTRTDFGLVLILALYKRIEKRGFFVTVSGYQVNRDYAFNLYFSDLSLDFCHGD